MRQISVQAVSYTHLDVYKRQRVRGCHAHARMRKVESGVCGARVRGS